MTTLTTLLTLAAAAMTPANPTNMSDNFERAKTCVLETIEYPRTSAVYDANGLTITVTGDASGDDFTGTGTTTIHVDKTGTVAVKIQLQTENGGGLYALNQTDIRDPNSVTATWNGMNDTAAKPIDVNVRYELADFYRKLTPCLN